MFYVSKKLTNECGRHHCRNHEICEEKYDYPFLTVPGYYL